MLYWRAVSRIISQVYPDVIQGFATVEEEEENPMPKAQVVAMPQEIEMPKPKRTRKVKAATEESSVVEEEAPITPILPSAEEMEKYAGEDDIISAAAEEDKRMMSPAEPVPSGVVVGDTPKRYVRFVKQVLLENGERYIIAKNPLVDSEDKWLIPTAGMACEIKKLTGMKAYIFVMNGKVANYEEYPEA